MLQPIPNGMKKYYYIDTMNQQQGPFDIEELRKRGITRATKVWFEGLPTWECADQIDELVSVFAGVPPQTPPMAPPPPVYNPQAYGQQHPIGAMQRPKSWLVESILATIFCCMPFGIAGIVFAARVEALWNEGRYAEAIKASKDAGKWTKISVFVAVGWWIVYCAFWLLFGISMMGLGLSEYYM